MSDTFFGFQERRLRILWRWGIASTLVGLAGLALRAPLARYVAIQTCSWGAIDAVLAYAGRHSARVKEGQLAARTLSAVDEQREARRFRRILLINALLDVGYIYGGVALARQQRPDRRGMGIGILPQGVFLLIFDSLVAWDVGRWQRTNRESL